MMPLREILASRTAAADRGQRLGGQRLGPEQFAYAGHGQILAFPAIITDNNPGTPPGPGVDPFRVFPRSYNFIPTADYFSLPPYGLARRADDTTDPNPIGGIWDYKFDPVYRGPAVNLAESTNETEPYILPRVVMPGTPVIMYFAFEFIPGIVFTESALGSALQNIRFAFYQYFDPESEICTPFGG